MRKVFLILALWASPALSCEQIADCFAGRQAAEMFGDMATNADKKGKRIFGEDFKIINRIRFSGYRRSLGGDLDAVFPFGKGMLQTGMTAWESGTGGGGRQDFRVGAARRWTNAEAWYGGMLGAWVFGQADLADGGGRIYVGGEYAGKYGKTTANYYVGGGKMMSGGDIMTALDLTGRLALNTRLSHWKSRSDSREYQTNGQIAANYQMREWLSFVGTYRASAYGAAAVSAEIVMVFALGAKELKPQSRYKPDYEKMRYKAVSRFKRVEYAAE